MIGAERVPVTPAVKRLENELILRSARSRKDSEGVDRVRELLQEEIDWEYLLQIAHEHRAMPLLRLLRETEDLQGSFDEESHFQPLRLQVMERLQDKVRYCIRQVETFSSKDWALRLLPVSLFPLLLCTPADWGGRKIWTKLSKRTRD